MNKYVFIAVNYNGSKYTINYIESINKLLVNEADKVEIVIVDNNSDSNDLIILEEYCKNISNTRIVKSDINLGYFKGLNYGIERADKDVDTILIVGNNDLTFDDNFLFKLTEIKYDDTVLVIAPNIITKDGRQQNPHVLDKVTTTEKLKSRLYFSNYYVGQIFRFINQHLKLIVKRPAVKNTYGQMKIKRGIGACYILTNNFFKYFSKLDDRVFMWGEEALLSNQVESVGGATLYDPTIIVRHHESASVSSIQSKRKYYMVKESYRIYKEYL